MQLSLDQLSLLPESIKRNILARLPVSNTEDGAAIAVSKAAAPFSTAEQQGPELSTREVLLPSLKAGAAVVDSVLSQVEIQVRLVQPITSHVAIA